MADERELAEAFLREAAGSLGSREDLDAFLEARRARLNPQLADQLSKLAKQTLIGQSPQVALMAGGLATSVNRRLNRVEEALEDRLITVQAQFHLASEPQDYENVRRAFRELGESADATGDAPRALTARCFAVQSAYFGAQATRDPYMRQAWIRRGLADFLDLLESQPEPMPAETATVVMDFVFATLDEATGRSFIDQEAMTAVLRQVTAAIDARVPVDAPLSEDEERDAAIAGVLNRLPLPQQ